MRHDFIKTGDADAYPQIQDRNGEVCLSQCRRCGQAEGELTPECPGVTADTITDEQIRELLESLRTDGEWTKKRGRLHWSRQDDMRACMAAIATEIGVSKWTRDAARARCAEILNACAPEKP